MDNHLTNRGFNQIVSLNIPKQDSSGSLDKYCFRSRKRKNPKIIAHVASGKLSSTFNLQVNFIATCYTALQHAAAIQTTNKWRNCVNSSLPLCNYFHHHGRIESHYPRERKIQEFKIPQYVRNQSQPNCQLSTLQYINSLLSTKLIYQNHLSANIPQCKQTVS